MFVKKTLLKVMVFSDVCWKNATKDYDFSGVFWKAPLKTMTFSGAFNANAAKSHCLAVFF